jgi:hypothetical protein
MSAHSGHYGPQDNVTLLQPEFQVFYSKDLNFAISSPNTGCLALYFLSRARQQAVLATDFA